MKVMIEKLAYMPERAHDQDAGIDLRTPTACTVLAHGWAIVDTGVHIELPPGTAGILISKSGLNVNHDITSTGLIDEGYTGSIRVKLYNHGDRGYRFEKGDKVSQLVIVQVEKPEIEVVESLGETDRGDKGFGSTGK